MTATDEAVSLDGVVEVPAEVEGDSVEVPADSTDEAESESGRKKRSRDFSKVSELHTDLADYVNAHSGLEPVTASQVKALLYLRPDFNKTPEQAEKSAARAARQEIEKARYAGLTDDQKKARKAAERANEQASKFAERARKAQEDADRLLSQANPGEDIASQVEAAQQTPEPEVPADSEERPRRIGRRGR